MKKSNLFRLSVFLLGLTVLINFGFCLAPFASAQTHGRIKQPTPVSTLNEDISRGEDNCENTSAEVKNDKPESHEARAEQSDSSRNSNTVLPCCLDHDRINKIDTAASFKLQNINLLAILENASPNDEAKIQNSSYANSIDLPPPEADVLFSVIKKE